MVIVCQRACQSASSGTGGQMVGSNRHGSEVQVHKFTAA